MILYPDIGPRGIRTLDKRFKVAGALPLHYRTTYYIWQVSLSRFLQN